MEAKDSSAPRSLLSSLSCNKTDGRQYGLCVVCLTNSSVTQCAGHGHSCFFLYNYQKLQYATFNSMAVLLMVLQSVTSVQVSA